MKRLTILAIIVLVLVSTLGCATTKPPAPAGGGVSTPTLAPPSGISEATVEAQDVVKVTRTWGDAYFLGFVRNVGNSPIGGLALTLTIYNKANVLTAQEKWLTSTSLRPGERYPFSKWFSSEQMESYDRYEIAIESWDYYEKGERLCPAELKVISDQWVKGEVITGTLQNTSQKTAKNVSICIAGYDNEGRLISVDSQSGGVTTIPPGVSATFKVSLLNGEPSKVANYDYFISARLEN